MEDTLEYTFVPGFAEFFESRHAQICLVLFLLGVTNSLSECFLNEFPYSICRWLSVNPALSGFLGFSLGSICHSLASNNSKGGFPCPFLPRP
jgi:hypothetical protein